MPSATLLLPLALLLTSLRLATARRADLAWAAMLALTVAMACQQVAPLLPVPLDRDAQIIRVACARFVPFGDWNHPFLSYLLNIPARFSSDPTTVRLVPALWAVLDTVALLILGARIAGRPVGALAAIWFAVELPRRMAVLEIGDWDLAGLALLAMVGWLHADQQARGAWAAVEAALLIAWGFVSSYLMWIGGAALSATLWLDRRPESRAARWASLPAVAASGLWLVHVFSHGAQIHANAGGVDHWQDLLPDFWSEWPSGRATVMALPMALGLGWTLTRGREAWARLTLLALALVPLAVLGGAARSHVNGGYYAGLVTPLWTLIAAGGTWALLRRAGDAIGGARGALVSGAVSVPFLLATLLLPGTGHAPPVWSDVRDVVAPWALRTHEDTRPILTNIQGLETNILWAWDRQGWPGFRGVAFPMESPLRERLVTTSCLTCAQDPACAAKQADGWAMFWRSDDPAEQACVDAWAARCDKVGVLTTGQWYREAVQLDCRSPH
jgi:hypothetical protein